MKRWLKYGLIGVAISFIGILGLLLGKLVSVFSILGLLNYINIALISLLFYGGDMSFGLFFWGILTAPILYFILGAIIGLIVDKIKSK
jgi:hypothetical protein